MLSCAAVGRPGPLAFTLANRCHLAAGDSSTEMLSRAMVPLAGAALTVRQSSPAIGMLTICPY